MSIFYKSLSYWESRSFQRRKKKFKKNKPCAVCGKMYRPAEMMVAHITPVRELSDYDALYDTTNWEVRCIYCERRLNREEALRKAHIEVVVKPKTAGVFSHFEMGSYFAYEDTIRFFWERATAGFNLNKKHRRSAYWERIEQQVMSADKVSLAKAAARFILMNNGTIPTREEVYGQLLKDAETFMLFKTGGKFKAGEKGGVE